jgi:hypothetical protein
VLSGGLAHSSTAIPRRSQQAVPSGNAAQVLGLAGAACRAAPDLLPPMRAALDQQEAHGFALDGDEAAAHRKLDDAHTWAATDVGSARTLGVVRAVGKALGTHRRLPAVAQFMRGLVREAG